MELEEMAEQLENEVRHGFEAVEAFDLLMVLSVVSSVALVSGICSARCGQSKEIGTERSFRSA